MTNRYALADYILTITLPTEENGTSSSSAIAKLKQSIGTLEAGDIMKIGGAGANKYEGSFLDSIEVTRKTELWSTKGDPTGSWIHTKNLDRTGTVSLSISQVADDAVILSIICNAYESVQESVGGLSLQIMTINNEVVVSCKDCYIVKVPDHTYGAEAQMLKFDFTCGCIMYYPNGK